MTLYKLLPEHEARFPEWRDKWIANAMSTSAMDENEREICRKAVLGLYAAAGLPAPKHIVFVPSPFVLRFAGGFAAAKWYLHHQRKALEDVNATDSATRNATRNATYSATDSATVSATYNATDSATRNATRNATGNATDNATGNATRNATRSATGNATGNATRNATDSATRNATRNATYSATDNATDSATRNATRNATGNATDNATDNATGNATRNATRSATGNATGNATYSATDSATVSATDSATDSATGSATVSATGSATDSATGSATVSATGNADLSNFWIFRDDARAVADDVGVGAFGIRCAQNAYNMWQGGNQWSAWDSFLTFFRHVAKLPLDYSKYEHWEQLSLHSGPRIMHPDFCMISDRPEVLMVDDQDRPHCENGPFCRWRDGSAIYAWHGVFVPARWIEAPDAVDPVEVLRAENTEQRSAGMAILRHRMIPTLIKQKRAKWIDDSGSPDIGRLIEIKLPDLPQPGRYLVAECPRNGTIMEGVPLVSDIDGLPINTAIAAQAWRIGDSQSEYAHPPRRT